MEEKDKEYKICLLCSSYMDSFEPSPISLDDIHKLFKVFGEVVKVMIFKRRPFLQAFVEFQTMIEAEQAIQFLHGCKINNFGIFKVYLSQKNSLSVDNQFLEVKQFGGKEDDLSTFVSNFDKKLLSSFVNIPEVPETQHLSLRKIPDYCSKKHLFSKSFVKNSKKLKELQKNMNNVDKKLHLKSKVVLISNLDGIFDSAIEIFNFFGCFGNISKILFMKNHQKTFVEYMTYDYACKCLIAINKLKIFKTTLKANYSVYESLNPEKNNRSENSQKFNEFLIFSPDQNRFASGLLPQIRLPSKKLFVFAEKCSSLTPDMISAQVKQIKKYKKAKTIYSEDPPFGSHTGIKMIFSFWNISQAITVMKSLHQSCIMNSRIDVFFS